MNVTDDDGDTPIYTVENVETATWLVQHGAIVERQNSEGISVCMPNTAVSHRIDLITASRTPGRRLSRHFVLSTVPLRHCEQ